MTVIQGVEAWISAGMPADKLVLGIPAYFRGWSRVAHGARHGLYGRADGPSPPLGRSATAGVAYYGELLAAGLLRRSFYDPVTRSPWVFRGGVFYTGDVPGSAKEKAVYAATHGLRGAMLFPLAGDDIRGGLLRAMSDGLGGK
jgi:chitinase